MNSRALAPSQDRFDYVDALRGLAALYVVLYHLALIPQPNLAVPGWASPFILTGGSGVTLFFIVSAFTLSLSMRRRGQEQHPTLNFYLRRLFRIVPLYYTWLALSLLRDALGFGVTYSWKTILLDAFFGFNFIPGKEAGIVWASWTLGVEMIFYLLFPLIFRYVNDLWKAMCFFFLTLLVAGFYANLLTYLPLTTSERESFYFFSFFHQLPVFALGILAFYIFERSIQNRTRPRNLALALAAIAAYGWSALLTGRLQFLFDSFYWEAILYSVLLLGLAVYPLRILVNRVTRFYGRISYSVYLNHPTLIYALIPTYRVIYTLPMPVTLQYGTALLLTLVPLTSLSYVTYRFIEQPGILLGSRLIKKLAAYHDLRTSARRPVIETSEAVKESLSVDK